MESRINELEARQALADDLLDELSRTIFRQQQQIDQLQQQLRLLWQQMQSTQSSGETEQRDLRDEIPPHY